MERIMSPDQPKRPDPERKTPPGATLADFVERSRKYRFDEYIEFDRPLYMAFPAPEVLD
jgi:hypothetical protein